MKWKLSSEFIFYLSCFKFQKLKPTFFSEESKRLTDEGIQIIIALVHSGFATDKIVAYNCPYVDVVVGGHTNTFLSNSISAPSGHPEKIEGNYPTIIQQKNGRNVYVVQAAAFTKYMGKAVIKVSFFVIGGTLDGNLGTVK